MKSGKHGLLFNRPDIQASIVSGDPTGPVCEGTAGNNMGGAVFVFSGTGPDNEVTLNALTGGGAGAVTVSYTDSGTEYGYTPPIVAQSNGYAHRGAGSVDLYDSVAIGGTIYTIAHNLSGVTEISTLTGSTVVTVTVPTAAVYSAVSVVSVGGVPRYFVAGGSGTVSVTGYSENDMSDSYACFDTVIEINNTPAAGATGYTVNGLSVSDNGTVIVMFLMLIAADSSLTFRDTYYQFVSYDRGYSFTVVSEASDYGKTAIRTATVNAQTYVCFTDIDTRVRGGYINPAVRLGALSSVLVCPDLCAVLSGGVLTLSDTALIVDDTGTLYLLQRSLSSATNNPIGIWQSSNGRAWISSYHFSTTGGARSGIRIAYSALTYYYQNIRAVYTGGSVYLLFTANSAITDIVGYIQLGGFTSNCEPLYTVDGYGPAQRSVYNVCWLGLALLSDCDFTTVTTGSPSILLSTAGYGQVQVTGSLESITLTAPAVSPYNGDTAAKITLSVGYGTVAIYVQSVGYSCYVSVSPSGVTAYDLSTATQIGAIAITGTVQVYIGVTVDGVATVAAAPNDTGDQAFVSVSGPLTYDAAYTEGVTITQGQNTGAILFGWYLCCTGGALPAVTGRPVTNTPTLCAPNSYVALAAGYANRGDTWTVYRGYTNGADTLLTGAATAGLIATGSVDQVIYLGTLDRAIGPVFAVALVGANFRDCTMEYKASAVDTWHTLTDFSTVYATGLSFNRRGSSLSIRSGGTSVIGPLHTGLLRDGTAKLSGSVYRTIAGNTSGVWSDSAIKAPTVSLQGVELTDPAIVNGAGEFWSADTVKVFSNTVGHIYALRMVIPVQSTATGDIRLSKLIVGEPLFFPANKEWGGTVTVDTGRTVITGQNGTPFARQVRQPARTVDISFPEPLYQGGLYTEHYDKVGGIADSISGDLFDKLSDMFYTMQGNPYAMYFCGVSVSGTSFSLYSYCSGTLYGIVEADTIRQDHAAGENDRSYSRLERLSVRETKQ
jgi:hypothetical protein